MRSITLRFLVSVAIASGVLLTGATGAWAQYAGAYVLQDPISARATAMGFTGAADNSDPANIWFNPANAVGAAGVYAEYAFWDLVPFSTIELPFERWALGGSFRLNNRVDMGVSTTFGELDYGTTYAYDTMGNVIPFESWERYASLALAVATRVDERVDLRLGAAFKRVWAEYAPPSFVQPPFSVAEGDGIACDVGTTVAISTDVAGWAVTPALGFAYVNFGGEIDFEDRGSDPFPARLHYGASIRVDGPGVALGPARVPLLSFVQNVDAVDRLHGDSYSWGMGAELAVLQILFLRAGTTDEQDEHDFDQSAWSIGIGAPVGPFRARFDYARVSQYDEPRYGFVASWEF